MFAVSKGVANPPSCRYDHLHMSDLPTFGVENFKELHLFPRTIFSIGGISFLGAFYLHSLSTGLLGMAAMFFGVGLNLCIDVTSSTLRKIWTWGIIQAVACGLVAIALVYLAWRYRPALPCQVLKTALSNGYELRLPHS
jgi:hypothetical protein